MARRREYSQKEIYKNLVNIEEEIISTSIQPKVVSSGGSVSNLPVTTPEFKKWLSTIQKKNPLIGTEWISPASELNSESEIISQDVVEMDESKIESLSKKSEKSSKKDAPVNPDDTESMLIDYSIVEGVTKNDLGNSMELLIEKSVEEIRKYRDNLEYNTSIDLRSCIENIKEKFSEKKVPKMLKSE